MGIALHCDGVPSRGIGIDTKPPLDDGPVIVTIAARYAGKVVVSKTIGKDAIRRITAKLPPVTSNPARPIGCPYALGKQSALSVAGLLGGDIDHSVDRVGSPYGGAGSPYDLDAINVLQRHVLCIPKHSGQHGRIHRPAVDQNQELVRILPVEASDADGPFAGVNLGHIHSWNHAQQVGYVGCARMPNVVLGNDKDRRRSP